MDELKTQLDDLNTLAEKIYQYTESDRVRLTRRRLLLLQKLLYIDANANAVARLLMDEPRYPDGAAMILRSMYDLGVNVDWVLQSRKNDRLWRWLRDDRKTLHDRLKSIVDLKTSDPALNSIGDPLSTWQSALDKVSEDLERTAKNAGVSAVAREESLFNKVKTVSKKSQLVYHTMFWWFSTKTHATPTGLQDLVTLNPLLLKRRADQVTDKNVSEATMLMRTALLWYAAHIRQTARYLKTPFVDDARVLYEVHADRRMVYR